MRRRAFAMFLCAALTAAFVWGASPPAPPRHRSRRTRPSGSASPRASPSSCGSRGGRARGGALLLGACRCHARRRRSSPTSRLTSHSNGAGQRLVEVVEVEDQPPVRRRVHAEIQQVRVAAALHPQARRRRAREVPRHDRRAAAVERERRDDHPPSDGSPAPVNATRVLLLQLRDMKGSGRGRRCHRSSWRGTARSAASPSPVRTPAPATPRRPPGFSAPALFGRRCGLRDCVIGPGRRRLPGFR